MFSARCTNPDCSTAFNHRRGRIFRFYQDRPSGAEFAVGPLVRHFWLCDACAQSYTLHYVDRTAVLVRLEFQETPDGDKQLLEIA